MSWVDNWNDLPSGHYCEGENHPEALGMLPPPWRSWISPLFIGFDDDTQAHGQGTAFRIARLWDGGAILATAKHVFPNHEQLMRRANLCAAFPIDPEAVQETHQAWVRTTGSAVDKSDVAFLNVEPTEGATPDSASMIVQLDFSEPQAGDRVLAIGYPVMNFSSEDHTTLTSIGNGLIGGTVGTITDVYPSRSRPGFYIDADTPHGMSGGPVISARTGGVIGIVSSGGNATDGGAYSHISLIGALVELAVDVVQSDGETISLRMEDLWRAEPDMKIGSSQWIVVERDEDKLTLKWDKESPPPPEYAVDAEQKRLSRLTDLGLMLPPWLRPR